MNLAHNTQLNLIRTILRTPLNWFEKIPLGRVMNRTCQNQGELDSEVVWLLEKVEHMAIALICSMMLIGTVIPYFFLGILFFIIVYIFLSYQSFLALREARRLWLYAKSPIFGLFKETLEGLQLIRLYGYGEMFIRKMTERINHCMSSFLMSTRSAGWITLRLEFVGAFEVAFVFLLATFSRTFDWGITSTYMGLALATSLNIIFLLGSLIKESGNLSTNLISINRIFNYIDELPQEKDLDEPEPYDSSWPLDGRIVIKNLYLRYRPDLDYVVNGLSLKVAPRDKLGIYGPSKSGKSAIVLSLLRAIEPAPEAEIQTGKEESEKENIKEPTDPYIEKNSPLGTILIDDQDIMKIGLHILRSKIGIIPQQPYIFSGTIRSNLNPSSDPSLADETKMLHALNKVNLYKILFEKIYDIQKNNVNQVEIPEIKKLSSEDTEKILDFKIVECGKNLIHEEKQLLCIARVILKKPQIVILDDATSCFTSGTEDELQKMIVEEFQESTVVNITDKIHNLVEYDKILVLREGKRVEYGHPADLLHDVKSVIRKEVKQQGEDMLKELIMRASKNLEVEE